MSISVNFGSVEAAECIMKKLENSTEMATLVQQKDNVITAMLNSNMTTLTAEVTPVLEALHTATRGDNTASPSAASCHLALRCGTAREAHIVANTLRVDKEPKRSNTTKTFEVQEDQLNVTVDAPDARELRTAVSSFLDLLLLTTRCISNFGPAMPSPKRACLQT